LITLATLLPNSAEAQYFGRPSNNCCATCQLPHRVCSCTSVTPVVETRLRKENALTYRDVERTGYRDETYCESVPVTTFEDVTSDEGNYKLVWVSKPVTRQVEKTVYEQRLRQRSVPYTYRTRVPELTTRYVPESTVRYVPRQTTVAVRPTPCGHCNLSTPIVQSFHTPMISSAYSTRPHVAFAPPPASLAAVPDPISGDLAASGAYAPWATVQPRRIAGSFTDKYRRRYHGADHDHDHDTPELSNDAVRTRTESSVRSPTAATVWQTPWNNTARR
jgi:hypothetical protein